MKVHLKPFEAAQTRIRCSGCEKLVAISPLADRYFETIVMPGMSLGGAVMAAHEASGHKLGTYQDAQEHGCEII